MFISNKKWALNLIFSLNFRFVIFGRATDTVSRNVAEMFDEFSCLCSFRYAIFTNQIKKFFSSCVCVCSTLTLLFPWTPLLAIAFTKWRMNSDPCWTACNTVIHKIKLSKNFNMYLCAPALVGTKVTFICNMVNQFVGMNACTGHFNSYNIGTSEAQRKVTNSLTQLTLIRFTAVITFWHCTKALSWKSASQLYKRPVHKPNRFLCLSLSVSPR